MQNKKNPPLFARVARWLGAFALLAMSIGAGAQSSDALLDLFVKKGIVTQEEAQQLRAEAQASRTNNPSASASKWKIGNGINSVELFGDIRLRFEDRQVHTPIGDRLELGRYRYALRLGLRGDLVDDFYYGLRLETASNPRSPWVTFGTSSSGVPYQGPFGKSTAGINLGQVYVGWRPASWVDIELGKMPNPLYTTPMTWDTDLNPEGAAERFKYTVGPVDFFATFGQFVYEDVNPNRTTPFLTPAVPFGRDANTPFLLSWQGGFNFNFTKDISFKAAATLYNYTGRGGVTNSTAGFSDIFVGESTLTPNSSVAGSSGYPSGPNDGFIFNQTGINDLLILDFPFELNFKIAKYRARMFGDFAENLDGEQRAEAAVAMGANALVNNSGGYTVTIPLQKYENKAYQFGLAVGNDDALGIAYGTTVKKNTWEARAYWQHVEQYALDPNLMDSDFFEGRANLQGVYAAFAYGFTDALIGTFRYGYASRIDSKLGTGGSNQDIPQVNPIQRYQLFQLDLTLKF
ncbi:MAG: putative porin [Verrucomicrobiota bacterium]|jgi:hypothetical protein